MKGQGVRQIGVSPVAQQRRELCIQFLEDMLARAKEDAGFEAVFAVATYPDSTLLWRGWTAALSTVDVVGRIEMLKHELISDSSAET